jgi:energy-coupling factor transporter ATP-binding protein EcfA2
LLRLRGLDLARDGSDGPVPVISNLDLDLAAGERLALLGGNGAGKSSLLRHLAEPGVVPGVRVSYLSQDPDEQLVARTVAGEVTLGHPEQDPGPLLAEVGLAELADVEPRLLSAGQKQRLQLAVALAQSPDLLLLDEPGSLQDAAQVQWLIERLLAFPGAVVWATQHRREAACCQRALYLDRGVISCQGPAADVADAAEVRWLWEEPAPVAVRAPADGAATVAELRDVSCTFHRGGLAGVSLGLAAGERVGIIGPNGCGKSTLLAILAGLRAPDGGEVHLAGRRLYRRARQDLDHGLVSLAPQFPEYFFVAGSVAAEARLAGVDLALALQIAGLPPQVAGRSPHDFSGGERRRLALALVVTAGRPLVLLDEPTAALDATGRRQVAALVNGLPATTTLVIASHDHAFLGACGCRILALGPLGLSAADG